MSWERIVILICDSCREEEYDEAIGEWSLKEARDEAHEQHGWVFKNKKDYCPDCAKELGLTD